MSLSFLPSAHLHARGAMEAGAKALWLMQPTDAFEREGRWLVHLEKEVEIRTQLSKESGSNAGGSATVGEFVAAVRSRLPSDTPVPKSFPNFKQLLESVGVPEKYIAYRFLSQTTHATHYGTGLFRQHLGSRKEFGEFAEAVDWWLPLSVQWWFLAKPAETIAVSSGLGELRLPDGLSQRFIKAQQSLARA
ncbi:MAG: hypothetical protein OZ919_01860 [Xanthomonadaceae bacterium]|nr:hypothetical protein [Xanthomonadaceae bacterium]